MRNLKGHHRIPESLPWHTWAVLCFFLLIGIAMLAYGIFILIKAALASAWPSTDGTIISAKLEGDEGSFRTNVTYDYIVNDVSYTGNKLRMLSVGVPEEYAQEDFDKYPVGKKVIVYYSLSDPADAVLEPGICISITLPLLMGIIATAIPSIVIFVYRHDFFPIIIWPSRKTRKPIIFLDQ